MRVSVIVPCYNSAQYLPESLESVVAQTRTTDELVVVDDGSTDDSAAIAASFPEVRVICQANGGVSAARNRGLRETTGELVVFHDADDRLLPGALESGIEALRSRPAAAFVFGFSQPIHADGTPTGAPASTPRGEVGFADLLRGEALVPPSCAMFRREALEAVGGFREGMDLAEDYDLYLRLAHRFPIHCHNRVVVDYRWHDENASGRSPCSTLRSTLAALERQRATARERPEWREALRDGRRHWARVFGPGMGREVLLLARRGRPGRAAAALALTLRHHPRGLIDAIRELLDGREADRRRTQRTLRP